MTAFDPDKRYDNVLQVKAALEKTGRRGRKPLIPAAAGIVLAAALAACGFLLLRSGPQPVSFSNPLIREAVRLNLGLPGEGAVTKEMLKQVSAVYIVANQACANENEFYAAIEAWYAGGKAERGNIRDLNDLSGMPQLKQVCIAAQELEDISALADMPQLTKVEMKHNKIGEISVLAGREHLTSVGFNDNPITDISPLAQCPGLRYLDLCDAHHYDPEVISELGDFVYLDLSNRTESFRYLAGKEIKRLRLAWTKLKNPEDLAGITGLEDLDIAHTQVSDLSPLSCHEELRRLNIAGSPVQDLTPLLLFPKLESVVLSRDMEHLADALKDPPFEILYE